jgi:cytochrome c oxidase subunit 2
LAFKFKKVLSMTQPVPPTATNWNHFFNLASTIALVAVAVVVGVMLYFLVVYRERKGQRPFVPEKHLTHTRGKDSMIFAIISIIILLVVSIVGATLAPNPRFEPANSSSQVLVVRVTAFQFAFEFEYPNGLNSTDVLVLPENTTVMFNVTSLDVMHNFYLIQYKVSIDAIPGRYNVLWITTPPMDGSSQLSYNIECKEMCGMGHTGMDANMTVVSLATYNQWLSSQANSTGASGG